MKNVLAVCFLYNKFLYMKIYSVWTLHDQQQTRARESAAREKGENNWAAEKYCPNMVLDTIKREAPKQFLPLNHSTIIKSQWLRVFYIR